MGGKDDDKEPHGFPHDLISQMRRDHDKFMREIQEDSKRLQQEFERDIKPSSPERGSFFVNFKDFIDSNLNSLAESFRSLPDNISAIRARMEEERERRKQEDAEAWRRWTGIEETADHCQIVRDRASKEEKQQVVDATMQLLRESWRRNENLPFHKIQELYKDDDWVGSLDAWASPRLSPGGACYYQPDYGYNAPSTNIFRGVWNRDRWLSIPWFKHSPYSPINLEHHPVLEGQQFKWRPAFEDLLDASLDKPMLSQEQFGFRPPQGLAQSTRSGPGLDWMLSLQCRGILPPQLPFLLSFQHVTKERVDHVLKQDDQTSPRIFRKLLSHDVDLLVDEVATPPAPSKAPQASFPLKVPLMQEFDETVEEQEATKCPVYDGDMDEQDYRDLKAFIDSQGEVSEQSFVEMMEGLKEKQGDDDTVGGEGQDSDSLKREGAQYAYERVQEAMKQGDFDKAKIWLLLWQDAGAKSIKDLLQDEERLDQEAEALCLDSSESDARVAAAVVPTSKDVSTQTQEAPIKVDVLSSLTTTSTTRLPDGTVTTKVVLKQRFADGREEVEEKIHTYQDQAKREPQGTHEPKKKGWFWT